MPITLSDIADQTVALNTATSALAFTVARSPIVVDVDPGAFASGDTLITLPSDAAELGVEVGAVVTVTGFPVGTVVASISGATVTVDQESTAGGDGSPITFAPPVSAVTVTAVSYDSVRVSSVTLGGSGASRTVTVTPATNKSGSATIQIRATVGDDEAVETFLLTITPATASYSIPTTWEAQQIGPKVDLDANGEKGTLKYAAPYPACVTVGNAAYRPDHGVAIAGITGNWVVGTVAIEPESAVGDGLAMVTIGLIPPEKSEATDSEGEPVQTTYRCHWENEMKPLHTASIYMPGGTYALTANDLADIELWKNEPDGTLRRAGKYKSEGKAPVTLSANAKHFAAKLLRGTESFPFAYPVVTKTGISRVSLAFATTMNKVHEAPPGFPKDKFPTGWLWIGVEDDREQQGRTGPKERNESYRGITTFDKDLYESAT